MSYARFRRGVSDVYVYLDCGGYLNCCGCWLSEFSQPFYTTPDMVAHLEEHRAAGHVVPVNLVADLEDDRYENDAWIAEEQQKKVRR